MFTIYLSKLRHSKYYIGKTRDLKARIEDHINSNASEWTKRHQHIEILETYDNCDSFDEDKYTLKAMQKYGIENVRGGSFSQIKLDKDTIKHINKMLRGAGDVCFKCGKADHWVADCPSKNNKEEIIESSSESDNDNEIKNKEEEKIKKDEEEEIYYVYNYCVIS